jgi:hypothetical protein
MMTVATREAAKVMLKEKGRELSDALRLAIPEGHGYLLVLTNPDGVAFFTDATKEQTIATLREVLAHLTDKRGES